MNTPLRFLSILALAALASSAFGANWPAWRGPLGTGISEETNLPVEWSQTQNVKWRVELPEAGNSTPIVWGDRVFLTQAIGNQRTLMCFNRNDGKVLWQSGVTAREKDPTHPTNPYCSASPVTDGERVIVSFASEGLFCYDFDGKEIWHRTDLGRQVHIWGNASSPVIHGDLCFLNFGPGETTYLLAVEKKTGKTVWKNDEDTGYNKPQTPDPVSGKTDNPQFIGSWTTPVITKIEGKDQLLMSWPRHLAAYDPATGKELWTCSGLNPLVYTSPIYGDGVVVSMGGYGGPAIGVRAGGSGDITATNRLWQNMRSPQRIGSGVVKDGHVYIHNDPGTVMCIDVKTGTPLWSERMKPTGGTGQNWSSVMLAGDKCYTITQGGDCFVFKADPKFELISVNSLGGERSNSSIVPSNGELFIRTHKALYCIAVKK